MPLAAAGVAPRRPTRLEAQSGPEEPEYEGLSVGIGIVPKITVLGVAILNVMLLSSEFEYTRVTVLAARTLLRSFGAADRN